MAEDDKPKHSKMYPVPSSIQMMARAMLGIDPPAQDEDIIALLKESVPGAQQVELLKEIAELLRAQQAAPITNVTAPDPAPPAKRKGYQPPARRNCNLWLVKQYDFENGSTDDKTFYTDRVEEWQRIRREQDAEANEKRPLDRKKDREKALANMRSAISKAREKRSRIA